jgi:hypothetical protein
MNKEISLTQSFKASGNQVSFSLSGADRNLLNWKSADVIKEKPSSTSSLK